MSDLYSLQSGPTPPPGATPVGKDADGRELYNIVAYTEHGEIPGKAASNGDGYYPYGEVEVAISHYDFKWIVFNRPVYLCKNDNSGPPSSAVKVGFQTDGGGDHYAAVADTHDCSDSRGSHPGKAKGQECWYSFGGEECKTSSFSWVCVKEEGDMEVCERHSGQRLVPAAYVEQHLDYVLDLMDEVSEDWCIVAIDGGRLVGRGHGGKIMEREDGVDYGHELVWKGEVEVCERHSGKKLVPSAYVEKHLDCVLDQMDGVDKDWCIVAIDGARVVGRGHGGKIMETEEGVDYGHELVWKGGF